jgi:hypothetical protein
MRLVAFGTPVQSKANGNTVVNAAGLVQGGTLVTFPAASSICTSPSEHDLTSAR